MPKKGQYIDITGQRFGRLTAIEYAGVFNRRRTKWWCQCDCGNTVLVESTKLRSGHTKSCGCINNERVKMLRYKGGYTHTKLKYTYHNMLTRCYWDGCKEKKYYQDKGITVCDEWRGEDGFLHFREWALANGYEEGLSIDRIDNSKGYSPENCRWVDKYVQANNKTNNRYVMVNGVVDTVGNHARRYGINYFNLVHYANGGQNCKYPELDIKAVDNV